MHVNTAVVKALMYLRGVGEPTLANLVHVTLADLQAWLYDMGENSEERVPFETQIEILRILGIAGEAPRGDVVHFWKIHEPLFSRHQSTYWALNVMLKFFGKAQAVYIGREADPAFCTQARSHFGLRFQDFVAILEVSAHPLRTISFDPETMPDLSWVPDTFGVLLPESEFDRLEPGSMKVKGFTQYITYTTEMAQWERLRESALEHGIRAEQVATLLLGGTGPTRIAAAPSEASSDAPHDSVRDAASSEPVRDSREAAVDLSRPVAPTAPTSPVRTVEDARNASDDMRLFVTPVKSVDKPALKRVS